jgi:hypothetical protein
MRKFLTLFATIMIVAGITTKLIAQTSSTVTGTAAGAKLVVPMTLTQTAALHFGTINVLTGAGGTVRLPSNSTTRVFSAGVAESTVLPIAANAAYTVAGTKLTTYALTLPPTITVTASGGTATMTISLLTARFNLASADAIVSTLDASGADNFTVGGTLTVPVAASAPSGVYAGVFNVTVDYN